MRCPHQLNGAPEALGCMLNTARAFAVVSGTLCVSRILFQSIFLSDLNNATFIDYPSDMAYFTAMAAAICLIQSQRLPHHAFCGVHGKLLDASLLLICCCSFLTIKSSRLAITTVGSLFAGASVPLLFFRSSSHLAACGENKSVAVTVVASGTAAMPAPIAFGLTLASCLFVAAYPLLLYVNQKIPGSRDTKNAPIADTSPTSASKPSLSACACLLIALTCCTLLDPCSMLETAAAQRNIAICLFIVAISLVSIAIAAVCAPQPGSIMLGACLSLSGLAIIGIIWNNFGLLAYCCDACFTLCSALALMTGLSSSPSQANNMRAETSAHLYPMLAVLAILLRPAMVETIVTHGGTAIASPNVLALFILGAAIVLYRLTTCHDEEPIKPREVESIILPAYQKDRLSPREQSVLHRAQGGFSAAQIARDLGIARSTVNTYLARSRQKLQHNTPAVLEGSPASTAKQLTPPGQRYAKLQLSTLLTGSSRARQRNRAILITKHIVEQRSAEILASCSMGILLLLLSQDIRTLIPDAVITQLPHAGNGPDTIASIAEVTSMLIMLCAPSARPHTAATTIDTVQRCSISAALFLAFRFLLINQQQPATYYETVCLQFVAWGCRLSGVWFAWEAYGIANASVTRVHRVFFLFSTGGIWLLIYFFPSLLPVCVCGTLALALTYAKFLSTKGLNNAPVLKAVAPSPHDKLHRLIDMVMERTSTSLGIDLIMMGLGMLVLVLSETRYVEMPPEHIAAATLAIPVAIAAYIIHIAAPYLQGEEAITPDKSGKHALKLWLYGVLGGLALQGAKLDIACQAMVVIVLMSSGTTWIGTALQTRKRCIHALNSKTWFQTTLKEDGLTPAELPVAYLLCAGESIGAIALHSYLSKNTVKTHRRHIYAKLNVHTRDEFQARMVNRLMSQKGSILWSACKRLSQLAE